MTKLSINSQMKIAMARTLDIGVPDGMQIGDSAGNSYVTYKPHFWQVRRWWRWWRMPADQKQVFAVDQQVLRREYVRAVLVTKAVVEEVVR